MANIIKKIIDAKNNLTTYRVGLLQNKAFRVLKHKTGAVLKPYELTTVDWGFLGVLFDSPSPCTATDLAEELDVELPFITEVYKKLEKKNLVESKKDLRDARIKLISLTEKGKIIVPEIEKVVRSESRKWLGDVGIRDVVGYIAVLNKIIEKK